MAKESYIVDEAAIIFHGGSTATEQWTSLDGLADNDGAQASMHNLGTAPRSRNFKYRYWIQGQLTPTVGESYDCYIKTSDGVFPDNDDGTGDIAVSTIHKLKNLKIVDNVIVDEAAAGVKFVASGEVKISAAWFCPTVWNTSGAAISATAMNSGASFIPIPPQQQG